MLLRSAARRAAAPLVRTTQAARRGVFVARLPASSALMGAPKRTFFFGTSKKPSPEGTPLTPSETVNALRAARDKANTPADADDIPEDTGAVPERFLRDETVLTEEQEALLKVRKEQARVAEAQVRRKLFILRTLVIVCGAIGLSLPALLIYANKDKLGFQWDYFPLLFTQPPMVEATSQTSFEAAFARACADVLAGVTPTVPAAPSSNSFLSSITSDTATATTAAALVPAPPTAEVVAYRDALRASLPPPPIPATTPLLALTREALGEPYVGRDPLAPALARAPPVTTAAAAAAAGAAPAQAQGQGQANTWSFWDYIPFISYFRTSPVSTGTFPNAVAAAGGRYVEGSREEEEYTLLSLHDAEVVARATLARPSAAVHTSLTPVLEVMKEKFDLATTDADQSRTFLAQFTDVVASGETAAISAITAAAEAQTFGYLQAGVAGLPASVPLVSQAELRRTLVAAEAARAAGVKAAMDAATGVWGTPSEGQKGEAARRLNVAQMVAGAVKDLEKMEAAT